MKATLPAKIKSKIATEAHRRRAGQVLAGAALWLACAAMASVAAQSGREAAPALTAPVRKVIDAALEQTTYTHSYDPRYVRIAYPGGDVPRERGVCTDVLVRAFRAAGVDLQKEVHEDMRANFSSYPQRWGLPGPDANIDQRRVPNLMTFFKRKGKALPVTPGTSQYQPGDIVAWDLGGGVLHIGVATDQRSDDGQRLLFVHNIGAGAKHEDILLKWRIIGHYRYF